MKEEKLQSLDDVGFPLLTNRHTLAAYAKVIVIRSRTFTFVLKTREREREKKKWGASGTAMEKQDGGCDGEINAVDLTFAIVCERRGASLSLTIFHSVWLALVSEQTDLRLCEWNYLINLIFFIFHERRTRIEREKNRSRFMSEWVRQKNSAQKTDGEKGKTKTECRQFAT